MPNSAAVNVVVDCGIGGLGTLLIITTELTTDSTNKKMLNMQQVPFSISALPPGGTFPF